MANIGFPRVFRVEVLGLGDSDHLEPTWIVISCPEFNQVTSSDVLQIHGILSSITFPAYKRLKLQIKEQRHGHIYLPVHNSIKNVRKCT
jgi:hypothetical protein